MTPQEAHKVLFDLVQQAMAGGAFKSFDALDTVREALRVFELHVKEYEK